MDKCMLVNMQRIMVFLRFAIENEKGKDVLSVFKKGIEGLICNDENIKVVFRKEEIKNF